MAISLGNFRATAQNKNMFKFDSKKPVILPDSEILYFILEPASGETCASIFNNSNRGRKDLFASLISLISELAPDEIENLDTNSLHNYIVTFGLEIDTRNVNEIISDFGCKIYKVKRDELFG